MTTHNGPPNYKSLAGTYTLGAGTTITIDTNEPTKEISEVNKYDIPIGALVFVKTQNFYHSFFSTSGWSHTIPSITTPSITTTPWPATTGTPWNIYGPTWIGGGTTTSGGNLGNYPYVVDSGTGAEIEFDSDPEIEESLQELYDAYLDTNKTGGGTSGGNGGFTLGMSTMGGNKKKSKKSYKMKKSKNSKYSNKSSAGTVTLNGLNSGPISISSTFPNLSHASVYPTDPEYQVRGYKTINDYFSSQNPVLVTQTEGLSTEELQKIYDDNGFYPEIGKPFHGIVVDKFIPKLLSEKGEEVELPRPTLYKVLINENNCLWVEESVLAPMKPEKCPLKEGCEETEEK